VRLPALAIAAVLATVAGRAHAQRSGADKSPPPGQADLARARALDKEGAKAYSEGRYNDAIRYFEEAHRVGGPPFELWNVAKCHLRLDQPEQAAEMLERYLATPSLPPEDRDEATQQLESLRKRPSTLTVSSSPAGAAVTVDGKPIEGAKTPLSVAVGPGPHTVTVNGGSHGKYTRQVEARYGRAIILDAPLAKDDKAPPPKNPYEGDEPRRVSIRAGLGLVLPRYGEIGGDAAFGLLASGTYRIVELSGAWISVGALIAGNGDTWKNMTGTEDTAMGCPAPLTDAHDATAVSFFGIGHASWAITQRLRAGPIAGVGAAAYFVDNVGGDLFVPSCDPSPGVRPALLLGGQLDFAISSAVRLTAFPLTWQVQPSFEGARAAPRDASGVWMRFGIALGAGVDL
jgi:PEGA domain-containing protein